MIVVVVVVVFGGGVQIVGGNVVVAGHFTVFGLKHQTTGNGPHFGKGQRQLYTKFRAVTGLNVQRFSRQHTQPRSGRTIGGKGGPYH